MLGVLVNVTCGRRCGLRVRMRWECWEREREVVWALSGCSASGYTLISDDDWVSGRAQGVVFGVRWDSE